MYYILGLFLLSTASLLGAGNEFFVTEKISFENETAAPDGTEWEWDFGDGKKSSDKNATHSYEKPGDYKVVLYAKAPNIDRKESNAIMVKVLPVFGEKVETLAFEIPGDGVIYQNQKYSFKDQNPVENDPRLSFTWKIKAPVGGIEETKEGYEPDHLFNLSGTNTVELSVEVANGGTHSRKGKLEVRPVTIKSIIITDEEKIKPENRIEFRAETNAPDDLKEKMECYWKFVKLDDNGSTTEDYIDKKPTKINEKVTNDFEPTEAGNWLIELKAVFKGTGLAPEPFVQSPVEVFTVISNNPSKPPVIKSIALQQKSIGQDGKYVAKVLVDTEGDYASIELDVKGMNAPPVQKMDEAMVLEERIRQHVFNIPLNTPLASYDQKEVQQLLRVNVRTVPGNEVDSNASNRTMELTINLIPPKPTWVLWAYLGGGLLVLIIIGMIALRFVRASG